jgi:hypothetical protein
MVSGQWRGAGMSTQSWSNLLRGLGRRPADDEAQFAARIEAAFAPDPARLDAMRSALLVEFAAASTAMVRPAPDRRRPGWVSRGLVAAVAAVLTLVMAVGLAAAADGPGQPFYGVRLTIEQLNLPSAANPEARLQAEIARLDTRLSEAQQAMQAGDDGAVDAALTAYMTELRALVGEHGWSSANAAVLEAGLARQATTLAAAGAATAPAIMGVVQEALADNDNARARVGATPTAVPVVGNGNGKGNAAASTATASPTTGGTSGSSPAPSPAAATPSPSAGNNGKGNGNGKRNS